MNALLPWLRGLRLVIHLLVGLTLAAAVGLSFGKLQPEPLIRWWSEILLEIFDIRLAVHGRGLAGQRVLVANHISWLDIPVIGALEATRFVAKSEIRDWPIAGWLARAAGTFFIQRGKGGARPLLERAAPHLAAGGSFVFFPEGTTTDGRQVLRFHPRLFAAAADNGVPVQPIALRYSGEVAPFIGEDDLVSHILRLLKQPRLTVEVSYCVPLSGLQRETLATHAEQVIRAAAVRESPIAPADEPGLEPLAA